METLKLGFCLGYSPFIELCVPVLLSSPKYSRRAAQKPKHKIVSMNAPPSCMSRCDLCVLERVLESWTPELLVRVNKKQNKP